MVQKYEVVESVTRRYEAQFEIEKSVARGMRERYTGSERRLRI
jgi:hypothetical protein